MSRVVLQFLTQPMDMHVYRARVDRCFAAPYVLEDLIPCQNNTAVAKQIDEQIEEKRAS